MEGSSWYRTEARYYKEEGTRSGGGRTSTKNRQEPLGQI